MHLLVDLGIVGSYALSVAALTLLYNHISNAIMLSCRQLDSYMA